jgi:hypothetical protein
LDEGGLIEYLAYIVITLISVLFGIWNAHMMSRLKKCDESDSNQWSVIHRVDKEITERFASHEKHERDRYDAHAAAIAKEVKELRKDVNAGHAMILEKFNELAREIRKNSNGKS